VKRWLGAALLLPLLATALTGCTKQGDRRDELTAAIDRTAAVSRSFQYFIGSGGLAAEVSGTIADDVSYRLDATQGGRAIGHLVVVDDAVAMQLTDAGLVAALSRAGAGAGAATPVDTQNALAAGKWVVDTSAARTLTRAAPTPASRLDPFYDALDALDEARQAVGDAAEVVDFNPDSPYYQPRLDTFPRPSAGERRYDLIAPSLPPKGLTTGNALDPSQLPHLPFFRRMSIYVRDGTVTRIEESVSIRARLLDASSHLQDRLGDFGVHDGAGAPVDKQASDLAAALAHSGDPIAQSTTSVRFSGLGKTQTVSLPDGATPGNLQRIGNHGQVLLERMGQ
jgi:hypothetical protein